jgi:hypothetical protein
MIILAQGKSREAEKYKVQSKDLFTDLENLFSTSQSLPPSSERQIPLIPCEISALQMLDNVLTDKVMGKNVSQVLKSFSTASFLALKDTLVMRMLEKMILDLELPDHLLYDFYIQHEDAQPFLSIELEKRTKKCLEDINYVTRRVSKKSRILKKVQNELDESPYLQCYSHEDYTVFSCNDGKKIFKSNINIVPLSYQSLSYNYNPYSNAFSLQSEWVHELSELFEAHDYIAQNNIYLPKGMVLCAKISQVIFVLGKLKDEEYGVYSGKSCQIVSLWLGEKIEEDGICSIEKKLKLWVPSPSIPIRVVGLKKTKGVLMLCAVTAEEVFTLPLTFDIGESNPFIDKDMNIAEAVSKCIRPMRNLAGFCVFLFCCYKFSSLRQKKTDKK